MLIPQRVFGFIGVLSCLVIVLGFDAGAYAAGKIDLGEACIALSAEDDQAVAQEKDRLSKILELDRDLGRALQGTSTREGALCLVSKLGREKFLPELIALAPKSDSAVLWSTLVAFAGAKTSQQLVPKAKAWVSEKGTSSNLVRRIGALQILSRLGEKIGSKQLLALLSEDDHEIKLRAMDYFSSQNARYSENEVEEVFKKALQGTPYQLRLAAIDFYRSLPLEKQKPLQGSLKSCKKDPSVEVREACPQ